MYSVYTDVCTQACDIVNMEKSALMMFVTLHAEAVYGEALQDIL